MSQFTDHGVNDSDTAAADTQGLPPAEALLAGTLALMTGHAQACCEGQRALMAKKIIANLFMLSRHPGAPPNFRAIAANLHPCGCACCSPALTSHSRGFYLRTILIPIACFGTQPRRPFNERSPSNPDAARRRKPGSGQCTP
jgi:hypothetical protein